MVFRELKLNVGSSPRTTHGLEDRMDPLQPCFSEMDFANGLKKASPLSLF